MNDVFSFFNSQETHKKVEFRNYWQKISSLAQSIIIKYITHYNFVWITVLLTAVLWCLATQGSFYMFTFYQKNASLSKAKIQNGRKAKGRKVPPTITTKKEEQMEVEDDDIDPLDAFMMTIDKEVNKGKSKPPTLTKGVGAKATAITATKGKAFTVVKTVVVKKKEPVAPTKLNKPEVMEQNQDALEYSSEEEKPAEITASDFSEAKVTTRLRYDITYNIIK